LSSSTIPCPAIRRADDLEFARLRPSAVLVPGVAGVTGPSVVVGGGSGTPGNYLGSIETYNIAEDQWTLSGALRNPRGDHLTALLEDGRIAFLGGVTRRGSFPKYLPRGELYTPSTGKLTSPGLMTTPRSQHTATSLNRADGIDLLIVGGRSYDGAKYIYHDTAERCRNVNEPAKTVCEPFAKLAEPRANHTETKLPTARC
jgi:hypothetical protein